MGMGKDFLNMRQRVGCVLTGHNASICEGDKGVQGSEERDSDVEVVQDIAVMSLALATDPCVTLWA